MRIKIGNTELILKVNVIAENLIDAEKPVKYLEDQYGIKPSAIILE